MNLEFELDWEEDEATENGRRSRRRAMQPLPAGAAEQYMWFNTFVQPEGTLVQ